MAAPLNILLRAILLATILATILSSQVFARTVIDTNGQAVEVPETVTKAGPLIGAFVQMTEMLTKGGGKVSSYPAMGVSKYFKKVFPDVELSNPNNYDSASVEDILASGTEVVYGPDSRLTEEQRAQLREAGVSVVAVTGMESVEAMCQSFLIIGDILGPEEKARAEEFVAYYKGNEERARRLSEAIAKAERKKVLILSGGGGSLNTVNRRDIIEEHIDAAGAVNVAADYMLSSRGMAITLDPEQILAWDPDLIVTYSQALRDDVLATPALAEISAVKNGRVLACPHGIYLWGVRSGEGAMMALWLGAQLYPERFGEVDMEAMVVDFFKRFYNYELPADELSAILLGGNL